ncbi:hypothetical protein LWI28_021905 [Acer negundo]|uniref:Aconitase A/isopropylmalate dehydratase small subunit swivel domain-containing protein n=1 Tax=Acer negundo TaxID=4023 RepID=A0AAD5IVM4_ACENE|nr:hypothetical protein LWI28_021905 [Acer negundo]
MTTSDDDARSGSTGDHLPIRSCFRRHEQSTCALDDKNNPPESARAFDDKNNPSPPTLEVDLPTDDDDDEGGTKQCQNCPREERGIAKAWPRGAAVGMVTLSQQITFPSRKHPQRQSCCEVSASPWGGKKELQFLRHGNDEVLARGTFANIRLVNKLLNDEVGPKTIHIPTGEKLSVFDAAMRYKAAGHDTIVLAGADYGSGSSRDWAAKVPMLLGVKPVIAKSFERIHRSNLVGMGIIPLCFKSGQFADTLGLTGHERYTIDLPSKISEIRPGQEVIVKIDTGKSFACIMRFDTEVHTSHFLYFPLLLTVFEFMEVKV